MIYKKPTPYLFPFILISLLFLFSCEEDAIEISPGKIPIFNVGDTLEFSANIEVDWILSDENAGTIDASGVFVAGDTVGSYVLEAVSKMEESNRQEVNIFISNRSEDLNNLLTGGYVIYLRHAIAREGSDLFDRGPVDWHRSCDSDTARQLSTPTGYIQAQELGEAFRKLQIPIEDTIYVSEYCRCIQTVEELALDLPMVQREEITFYVYDENLRHANTQAFINSFSPTDKNVLMVSHSFGPGNTYQQPEQGYSVIFRKGNTAPEFVTVIRDDEFIEFK